MIVSMSADNVRYADQLMKSRDRRFMQDVEIKMQKTHQDDWPQEMIVETNITDRET